MHTMLDAVLDGAGAEGIEGVEVVTRAALSANPIEVLEADGYVLGTPANLGYMSGALKHFFDIVYYPCLEQTRGRPYAVYVHGDNDTTGALAAIEKIVAGLGWRRAQAPVSVTGPVSGDDHDRCWELGAALAAGLAELG